MLRNNFVNFNIRVNFETLITVELAYNEHDATDRPILLVIIFVRYHGFVSTLRN